MSAYPTLRPFVVHGHNHVFRDEVVQHLKDLSMEEPIVLDAVASAGRTIIEKFEEESAKCNLAIVLLTPDDEGVTSSGTKYRTARPNVWFELGYFIAKFGRKPGRTIMIYKSGLDIPTDLAGVLYIDATAGMADEDVTKRLEMELNGIVNPPTTVGAAPNQAVLGEDLRVEGILRFSK